jgi:hypothetical protein
MCRYVALAGKNKGKKLSRRIPSWEYSGCARINSEDNYVCVRTAKICEESCVFHV